MEDFRLNIRPLWAPRRLREYPAAATRLPDWTAAPPSARSDPVPPLAQGAAIERWRCLLGPVNGAQMSGDRFDRLGNLQTNFFLSVLPSKSSSAARSGGSFTTRNTI